MIKIQFSIKKLSVDGQRHAIDLEHTIERNLGLRLRSKEVNVRIKCFARKFDLLWDETSQQMIIPAKNTKDIANNLRGELTLLLTEIANRPLTPKMLLKVLPITNRERLRWTKDGRLRSSGRIDVDRGRSSFSFPTYPVSIIEALAADLEQLADWRRTDDAK